MKCVEDIAAEDSRDLFCRMCPLHLEPGEKQKGMKKRRFCRNRIDCEKNITQAVGS